MCEIICIHDQLPSNKLLSLFRASSDKFVHLNLRRGGHDSARAREMKQITIAVRLSDEFRRDASITSS